MKYKSMLQPGNVVVLVAQSCQSRDPMNCSLPDPSVHGILQARTLEWIATSFPRGSSQPREGLPHCRQILYCLSPQGSPTTGMNLENITIERQQPDTKGHNHTII